jgi:YidC/Oxa1 family membrane protein insertase
VAAVDFLSDALASLLALFYQFVPSYAGAIILLTLLVMVVLTPLTLKGTRSMMLMQQLQPEMRKIQTKYKDDRQKLNEELLAFYKEKNINPMGGCLPLFAQMPVFFVLYSVLRGLTRRESSTGFDLGWVTGQDLAGAAPTDAPTLLLDFDPAYLHQDTDLYQSLSRKNEMEGVFGLLDLSESASQALGFSVVEALPYLLLIAVVAVSGYVQQKQIQGRMSKDQVNPQQQMLMKITPIMLPVFSFTLPAGLVLYFVVSNLYRIGQQWFITRSIYGIKRGETADSKKVVVDTTGEEVEERSSKAFTEKKGVPTPSAKGGGKEEKGGGLLDRARARAESPAKGGAKNAKNAKGGGGAKRSSGKRTTPAKPKSSTPPDPVLQPRARKNKKR